MKKILFLGSGSKDDPGFDNVDLDGMPYKEYMKRKGVTVVDKVIESCHGCYDLMSGYSKQMQSMVELGDRVVAILEGGLLFGLPSIQATQTTYPIISVPMDMVSFTAFMVPTGHAVVAGVGVPTEKEIHLGQKEKALTLAERMLNSEDSSVYVTKDVSNGKLEAELAKFGINIDPTSGLALAYDKDKMYKYFGNVDFMVRADPDENMKSWEYLQEAEKRHHSAEFNHVPTAQVKGVGNLAIYAAKILSLSHPEMIGRIKKIAEKKREGYEERNLINEIPMRRD